MLQCGDWGHALISRESSINATSLNKTGNFLLQVLTPKMEDTVDESGTAYEINLSYLRQSRSGRQLSRDPGNYASKDDRLVWLLRPDKGFF
jgi:hypothetical protein